MKKAAILTITAFYLLLTTGMFVCMIHCVAENMVAKPAMAMDMQHHPKDCCKENGNDCCKKHGNYVIKENIKPAVEIQCAQTALPALQPGLIDFPDAALYIQTTLPPPTKAPPDKSGKALVIQNRTILI